MLEAAFVIALPFAVKYITSFAKNMGEVPTSDNRVVIIRGIVALLSLAGAVLAQAVGDGELDPSFVETSLYTIFAGVTATLLYLREKRNYNK